MFVTLLHVSHTPPAAACVGVSLVNCSRSAIFRYSEKMFKNTKRQRQLSDGGLLFKTLVEFMNCWGSGRRSRLFVETMNGEAFMNFSTFLGNPGKCYSRKNKMASGEETLRNPESNDDPKSSKRPKKKKSKRKTERDNQRAAEFQKRKQDELLAAAATEGPTVSAVVTTTSSTPYKEFEFSDPIRENTSNLDSSDNSNVFMNLDGNLTLQEDSELVKENTAIAASPTTAKSGFSDEFAAAQAKAMEALKAHTLDLPSTLPNSPEEAEEALRTFKANSQKRQKSIREAMTALKKVAPKM